jgi:hypothetical protein
MTAIQQAHATSPFDSLKHAEMWQPAGYSRWQRFEDLVKRAITVTDGIFPGQIVFTGDGKNSSGPQGGRPAEGDYRCTRYGAYMILSRSDKPHLAGYFVMQTLFAENARQSPGLPIAGIEAIARAISGGDSPAELTPDPHTWTERS